MLAARFRVSMSLWSWVIWVCLAAMALVISLTGSSPSPARWARSRFKNYAKEVSDGVHRVYMRRVPVP